MLSRLWRWIGQSTVCGVALLAGANLAQAQVGLPAVPSIEAPKTEQIYDAPARSAPTNSDEKARIERLERELQELRQLLQARPLQTPTATEAPQNTLSTNDVHSMINSYFAEKEQAEKAKTAAAASEGYKVGTNLTMSASWKNGVVIETPNKDFWMRAGFRFQWDNVWFNQSAANKKAAPIGIGQDIDGDYWRRIRPNFNGGFWEVGEFNVEVKLENIQNGISGMDDVWVGVKDVPFLGTVRVGHFHLAHGLEADMYSSSKPMTFFEVYSGNNAFFGGERCGSGIWLTNTLLNERATWAVDFYRPENDDNGTQFQQGDYAYIIRGTCLPIWENDRCFLHLGASYTWRHAQGGIVAFQTDAQLRDRSGGDNGYGTPLTVTTTVNNAPKGVSATSTVSGVKAAPGNATNWVSTGNISAEGSSIIGAELLFNRGPFSIQAEYDWAFIDDAIVGGVNRGNIGFTGGYVQVGYFITGESRQYDKRFGKLNSEYIARPNTPFWLVRGDDGRFNYGLGAWEIAARLSRIDLNGGPITGAGFHVIQGGILDQGEIGINWHLNNNFRLQFMYLHAVRNDMPAGVPGSWMNGFGIRTQLTF